MSGRPQQPSGVDVDELEVEHLPPLLRDLFDLIGPEATMQLVQAFGGRRLYVPIKPSPDHRLAKLIGVDALKKLSAVYGSESHFLIPTASHAMRRVRDRRIRSEYGPKSVRQLAEKYQMGERHIWRIVAAPPEQKGGSKTARAADKQQQLFD